MSSQVRFRRKGVAYIEGERIQPVNIRKQAIEDYASQVASIASFKPGQSFVPLIKTFGGSLHQQHMDEWLGEDGSIFVHAPNDFDILIPYYTSPRRNRFTVAHELGHYFLHSQQGAIPVIAHRRGSGRIESEANWFAAGLLMPRDAFTEQWNRLRSIELVAEFFDVSVDAARVRKESVCG